MRWRAQGVLRASMRACVRVGGQAGRQAGGRRWAGGHVSACVREWVGGWVWVCAGVEAFMMKDHLI